jgi:hypothetical protein
MRAEGLRHLKICKGPTVSRTRNLQSVHRMKIRTNVYELLMCRDGQKARTFPMGFGVKNKMSGAAVLGVYAVSSVTCAVTFWMLLLIKENL